MYCVVIGLCEWSLINIISQEAPKEGEEQTVSTNVIKGAAYKENTPVAIKSYHEKPIPTKEFIQKPHLGANTQSIQQPRRQN